MKLPITVLVVSTGIFLFSSLLFGIFSTITHFTYHQKIVPHVTIGGIDVSGLDRLTALNKLQTAYDAMINTGLTVEIDHDMEIIPLFSTANGSDVAYHLLEWDPTDAVTEALRIGHHPHPFFDAIHTAYSVLFRKTSLPITATINTDRLQEAVLAAFPDVEQEPTATDFHVSFSKNNAPIITITPGKDGSILNLDPLFADVQNDIQDLSLQTFSLATSTQASLVTVEDATLLIPRARKIIAAAPYRIEAMNTAGENQQWLIDARTIADWIVPINNAQGILTVNLDATKMLPFFTELHQAIDVGAKNARFTIDGGKVSEFQESSLGHVVDDDAFFAALESALGTNTTTPIAVVTRVEEPSIRTENINSFGIKEIVGQATTTFPGASANRKANIVHGANKLHGLLIAPGETVSLIEVLKPFTVVDGYVPELVIRGDEIKPEVGGGLCQLGTTAFRAVMYSGLEVVERRNHSLAVSYYNDVTNGNPGTDATLYDPAPDFKFRNDMSTHLLLTTTINDDVSAVTFTFWGTKDGRSGSYTPPVILTRTNPGATQYKETSSLAPGEEQCQHAFPGATTTFDYTVTYADTSTKTIPFFSSYRALPQICLIGKATSTTTTTNPEIVP